MDPVHYVHNFFPDRRIVVDITGTEVVNQRFTAVLTSWFGVTKA